MIKPQLTRKPNLPNRDNARAGNALTEYGVVGALIAVVAIGGFMVLGGDFNGVLASLNADMKQKVQVSAAKNQEIKASKAAEKARQEALEQARQAALVGRGSSGTTQTLGANGNDMQAQANTIEAAAKRALAAGNVSPEQYDMLMRMAQLGHEMAKMEGALALARGSAGGNTGLYNTLQVNYNGRSYTPADLANMMTSNVTEFGSLRYHAEGMGLFANPDVGTIVNTASQDILGRGGASADISKDATKAVQVGGITEADLIHNDSATVCTAGNHSDSGTSCNP